MFTVKSMWEREENEDQELRGAQFHFRRELEFGDMLPALGAGLALGLAGMYVVRLLLQRTPLSPDPDVLMVGERGTIVRRPATRTGDDGR